MKTTSTEPMDASKQFCPHETCSARGQIGAGNLRIHSYRPQRYRCHTCQKTFSARRGTMMEGLRTPTELVVIVVILHTSGCPIQAIVHAYGLDERTVADWQKRAGQRLATGPSRHRRARKGGYPSRASRCASGRKGGKWSSGWAWLSMPRVVYGWRGW